MEEKQFLKILVRRYKNNELDEQELEAFFYLMRQGKLDSVLDEYLDEDIAYQLEWDGEGAHQEHLATTGSYSIRIAASVVMFLALGLTTYVNRNALFKLMGRNYMVTVTTGKNEKLTIHLPDGSLLWLNESSTVEYPSSFAQKIRKVTLLEGEAYFDVKRNEKCQFIVEAAGTTTRVLGTAFNIKSYHYLNHVQVTVSKGEVIVEEPESDQIVKRTKVLLRNDQANIDLTTREIRTLRVNSANSVAWKHGKLLFENEELGDIIITLENKFEVKIVLADESIKKYPVSAEFMATDTLDHILSLLSLANSLEYQIDGNQVTINKKKIN